jgi:ABC-2 type transport system ATP-binding protein
VAETVKDDVAIRVKGLTKSFGNFVAVRDVSFDVRAGEIFGYLGANGAGKSTTIRILCGLLGISAGEAVVAGIDVVRRPRAVRSAIGYMSQKFSLYVDLTVEENLVFFGGAYGLFGSAFRTRCDAVARDLGIEPLADRLTASLPGGLRQRLALACALLHEPRIVFLDEPTAGVDPEARRTFWRLIRRLADAGTTIFVTTHYMDEAEYCDRVGLMVAGRLAALDTPAALKSAFVPGRMLEVHGASAADVQLRASSLGLSSVEPFGAALHVRTTNDGPDAEALRGALERSGVQVTSVAETQPTLEDVFLRVVGDADGTSAEGGVVRGDEGTASAQ